ARRGDVDAPLRAPGDRLRRELRGRAASGAGCEPHGSHPRRARHHAAHRGTRPDDRLVSRREGPCRAGYGAMSDRGNVRLALKVDVDTHDGLARGVPAIAELLARCGVPASFFVACGPDRMGRRIARLLDPRFGAKLLRTRAVAVDAAGFAYRSDTRGSYPYLPAAAGQVFRAPEIPTTLPTLDEVYGRAARGSAELADYYVGLLRPDALNVHTIHAELEGGPYVG